MGNQNDRFALFTQTAKDTEKLVRLSRGQNARRFVEDQNVGLTVERLEDLNTLLHPDTDLFDNRIWVHVEFVFFGQLL